VGLGKMSHGGKEWQLAGALARLREPQSGYAQ
jgi:hypothetical protein